MTNSLTTNGSWVNGGPVSTPPQQLGPPSVNSNKLVSPYTESLCANFEPKTKIEFDSAQMQSTAMPQPLFTSEKNTAPFTHSPALISPIFPNELPARPAPRPSLISRVFHLSSHATRPPRCDKRGDNVFGTPDIEMGRHGTFTYGSRKDEKYHSVKLGLLLAGGTVLCMMLGMVVYLVVMYAQDEHQHMHVSAR
ncbi:uncharacterized protein yc1106_07516 [Curvularia clavata]|uniref:Uncharacterized protein n=1 Tax=Curvularia clavata TaxID=95742 RepID=A0A9Q9DUW6_CURCL|nr:uncharacterized protein yc1106_07516 [Curvularia clavata]